MKMKKIILFLFAINFAFGELQINNWRQRITMKDQTPVYYSEITIFNKGHEAETIFQVALPNATVDLLANIGAEDMYGNFLKFGISDEVTDLRINDEEEAEFQIATIEFNQPLAGQQELTIQMPYVMYGHYQFLPDKIDLFEDQKVVYHAQIIPTVAYEIKELAVEVMYGDRRSKFSKTFDNVPPYSYKTRRLHFSLNTHFLQMRSSSRYIEVSHWGNVKFSEVYDMENRGAKLIGHFSNIDFTDKNPKAGRNAFKRAQIELPYEAWGFSYRDELGNISTSLARKDHHAAKALVTLTPRFALQGGWNSTWEIGYNIPASELLKQNSEGTEFIFEYPMAQTIKEGISDEFTITIALPEGAEITEVDTEDMEPVHQERTKTYGYLDFMGRPSVVLKFKNHVPKIVDTKIRVRYKFSKQKLMIEPVYLVSGLFSLFLVSITIGRLNLDFKEN